MNPNVARWAPALLRGLEAGLVAAAMYLVQAYIGDGSWTVTHAVDVVKNGWDPALGAGLLVFLGAFGLTKSPVPNISPVRDAKKTAALAGSHADTYPHDNDVATDA